MGERDEGKRRDQNPTNLSNFGPCLEPSGAGQTQLVDGLVVVARNEGRGGPPARLAPYCMSPSQIFSPPLTATFPLALSDTDFPGVDRLVDSSKSQSTPRVYVNFVGFRCCVE